MFSFLALFWNDYTLIHYRWHYISDCATTGRTVLNCTVPLVQNTFPQLWKQCLNPKVWWFMQLLLYWSKKESIEHRWTLEKSLIQPVVGPIRVYNSDAVPLLWKRKVCPKQKIPSKGWEKKTGYGWITPSVLVRAYPVNKLRSLSLSSVPVCY